MKPISNKEEILRLMREGWELGYSVGIRQVGRYWLQKDGLCKGGDSRNVHASTVRSMIDKSLIKRIKRDKDKFWLTRYEVT